MIRRARCGEARLNDARLWHRVLRVMLHTRWSAEARAQVRVEFSKALALRSEIRHAEWFATQGRANGIRGHPRSPGRHHLQQSAGAV
jgi:hypothetical protein